MFGNFRGQDGQRSKKIGDRQYWRNGRQPAGRSRIPLFELLEQRDADHDLFAFAEYHRRRSRQLAPTSHWPMPTRDRSPTSSSFRRGRIFLTSGSGELDLTNTSKTVIIDGAGMGQTTIDQFFVDRVFNIAAGATVIFENLEITGGTADTDSTGGTTEADGGGILNLGTLTLTSVEVDNNTASEPTAGEDAVGGGIYSAGTLTIQGGSVISDNTADAASGTSTMSGGDAHGGGIFSATAAPLKITGATVSGNAALGGTGADGSGGDGQTGGMAEGGGVYIVNSGTTNAQLKNVTIAENMAVGGGGGAGSAGFGGGTGGIAAGGGVFVNYLGPVSITNTTISGNSATSGTGGSGTTAGLGADAYGGGIEISSSGSQMLNDTVYGNTATGGSGSTSGNVYGGGIEDETGISTGLTIVNCTVAANAALALAPVSGGTPGTPHGGGIDNDYVLSDSHLVVYNTLDATNTATGSPDFAGAAAIANSNLIGDGTGATGFSTPGDNNQVGTSGSAINPLFAVAGLINNGGNTDTVALRAGSPAMGAGNVAAAIANGLTTDQRGIGFARIVNNKVDIGAVETNLQMATVTNAATTENTQTTSGLVITPAAADAAFVTNFQITGITGGTLFQADGTTPIANGDFITVAQGAAGLKFTPTTGSLASGSFTVQESTSGTVGGLSGTTVTATITVTLAGPSVTDTFTTENTQTTIPAW